MKYIFFIFTGCITLLCATTVYASVDSDGDGLSDDEEINIYGSNPTLPDSDGDGYSDGTEIMHGYSPITGSPVKNNSIDTDGDGLWDDWEIVLGTAIKNQDTDGDGYNDGLEVKNGYDPRGTSSIKLKKLIKVDVSEQKLEYFFGETRLDSFKISSGVPGLDTPIGDFHVIKKRPTVNYAGSNYNYPDTKWNLMFKYGSWGNYYIHGAYWHNNFGNKMSHGCINVPYTYEQMGRLYDWADVGTKVSIS